MFGAKLGPKLLTARLIIGKGPWLFGRIALKEATSIFGAQVGGVACPDGDCVMS